MLNEVPLTPLNITSSIYAWIKNFENDVIQGIVHSSNDEKWIVWKGVRIPLPKDVELTEGTWIQIRLLSSQGGYEMKFEVIQEPVTDNLPSQATDLSAQKVVDISDKNSVIRELVQKMINQNPELIGKTDFVIKLLGEWFDEENTVSHLLFRINKIVQEAIDKGILEPSWLKMFPQYLSFSFEGKVDWQIINNYLKQQMQYIIFEKQLFREKDVDIGIQKSIVELKGYRVLYSLLKNEMFVSFLKSKGYYQEFQKSLDSLFSKLTTNQILNLNNAQYNYLVFELPFSIQDGFSRVCIHTLYSKKDEHGKGKKPKYAIIAFDIELINMGKMWIELCWLEEALECVFRIAEEKTQKVCNQFMSELESSFKVLGLKNVNIHVHKWDGNRVKNVFSLLQSIENKGWSV
ncbi:MAG: hypothetical protein ACP5UA_12585 [Candidatus Hydrogenedens sp.]